MIDGNGAGNARSRLWLVDIRGGMCGARLAGVAGSCSARHQDCVLRCPGGSGGSAPVPPATSYWEDAVAAGGIPAGRLRWDTHPYCQTAHPTYITYHPPPIFCLLLKVNLCASGFCDNIGEELKHEFQTNFDNYFRGQGVSKKIPIWCFYKFSSNKHARRLGHISFERWDP